MMALYPTKISVFILGFSIGTIFGLVFIVTNNSKLGSREFKYLNHTILYGDSKFQYMKWLSRLGFKRYNVNFDHFQYSANKSLGDYLENRLLKTKISILCVVFVKNVDNAYASINTWLKQCNNVMFYSMKSDKFYIDVTVIRAKNSWHYLCEVLRHLKKNSSDYMWAMFVPDDVFAIPDNLRYYVLNKNFAEPYYLGHRARFWNEHYNLAQAGFVLSKASIESLVTRFPTSESCVISGKYWKNEDFYLGKYLSQMGITPIDTRDQLGRGRFHVFNPEQLLAPGDDFIFKKYWTSSEDGIVQGSRCCSPHTITFQGTSKDWINFYYYLLYRVKVHLSPGTLGNNKSSIYIASDKVWKQFVVDELGTSANLSAITSEEYYKMWSRKIEPPSIFNSKLRALLLGDSNNND